MRIWLIVRCVIVIVSVVEAFFVPLRPQAQPPIGWVALLAIFAGCSIGLFLVIGFQAANPFSAKLWLRPSWQLNPFNFSQPLQFFHLAAYGCLASGLVVLVRLAIARVPFYVEALLSLAMGVGFLVGIQLVMLVFGARVEHRA